MTGTYEEYKAAIRQYEASGNYSFLNPDWGFAGAYQFTEDALNRIGYYNGDSTTSWPNDWTGSWSGKDGIDSLSEFLNQPSVQDEAFLDMQQWVWNTAFRDFDPRSYIGQTIDGVKVTEAGLLAGAHLVGAPALLVLRLLEEVLL